LVTEQFILRRATSDTEQFAHGIVIGRGSHLEFVGGTSAIISAISSISIDGDVTSFFLGGHLVAK
jgi:hypothetical protein